MKFGSWSYDEDRLNLTMREDNIDLSPYQPSGEWDLLGERGGGLGVFGGLLGEEGVWVFLGVCWVRRGFGCFLGVCWVRRG